MNPARSLTAGVERMLHAQARQLSPVHAGETFQLGPGGSRSGEQSPKVGEYGRER